MSIKIEHTVRAIAYTIPWQVAKLIIGVLYAEERRVAVEGLRLMHHLSHRNKEADPRMSHERFVLACPVVPMDTMCNK